MDIKALAARLEAARQAYYNGQPLMSDAEYDALEDELRKADPGNAVLKAVGVAPLGGSWPKVRHSIPMGSLDKAQTETDMAAWFKTTGHRQGDPVVVTEKLDGISISLKYENRKLVQAVTRGDGDVGEDITRNVLLMKGFPKVLPPKMNGGDTGLLVWVRGEIVVHKSDFVAHFKGESNPRSTASGTAKRQSDPAKCAHLTVIAYVVLPDGQQMPTKTAELDTLKAMGFKTPNWIECATASAVDVRYRDYVAKDRAALDYEIDGLVVEFDSTNKRDALGSHDGRPNGAVAFKFPHEAKPTVLRAVRWQVGNSGRITPVAEFDSVSLVGANVKQASLHNISNIAELVNESRKGETRLRVGDRIVVSRRNDVIPYVESVIGGGAAEIPIPTECPSCKGPLVRDGEYLVCKSEDCEAQAAGMIKRWTKKIGVLHVGDSLIEAMAEAFPHILPDAILSTMSDKEKREAVMDPADLYTLDVLKVSDLEIGGRKVGGSGDKAIKNLNAKKVIPLHVFVGSLGIPLIGRSMAKMIVDGGYDTPSKMLQARIKDIAAIPGVGQTKAEAFVLGFEKKVGLVSKLLGVGILVQTASGPLKGKSFCMTGFRSILLQDALEKAGGTMKSSAGKGLTYLIAKDKTSTSGKMQAAIKNGTTVIDEEDAWVLLGQKMPR